MQWSLYKPEEVGHNMDNERKTNMMPKWSWHKTNQFQGVKTIVIAVRKVDREDNMATGQKYF